MTPAKILFIDDEPNVLAAFRRTLQKQFAVETAGGATEGLQTLQQNGPFAVVVADMRMPGMNGVELLEQVREVSPDTVRMMLTGNADSETAAEAVNRGQIFRFLRKPCPPEILVPALQTGLKQYDLLRAERELLEGTLTGSVKLLGDILGLISPEALGRGQRLRQSIRLLAAAIKAEPIWEKEVAALLSTIGYASMPVNLLRKAASGADLRLEEAEVMRRMPAIGHDLIANIPRLAGVAAIVLYQHKHFDGTGFPTGDVAGEEIPVGARMLKILIDRTELEEDGIAKQKARSVMLGRSGQYDPELLEHCFTLFPEFLAVKLDASRPVLTLRLHQLRPGYIVVSGIASRTGLTIVGAGSQLTQASLKALQNYVELGEVREPFLVQEPAVTQVLESPVGAVSA